MRKLIAILLPVLAGISLQAKVTLPSFIGDNMVLQQKAEVSLWGSATPDETVLVSPTWAGAKTVSARADANGRWSAKVQTPSAGGPYKIVFVEDETLTVRNIMIGEVWFCSGQSNMEMPMRGFGGQPVEGGAEAIMSANPDVPVRMCTVKHITSRTESSSVEGKWQKNTPEAVAGCSAAAYFFGTFLQKSLGVPVGLLIADWGGTPIESWMDRETIASQFAGEFDLTYLDGNTTVKNPQNVASTLFNGMVAPLMGYTFKGMLWYQGCANRHRYEQYERLQPAYVEMMRRRSGNPDAAFYFVQLAPYSYGAPDDYTLGYMCESQARTLEKIPHSGMVTTADVGEYGTIHPCMKRQVGERLAFLALYNDYGVKVIDPTAPMLDSWQVVDGKPVLTFKVGGMGLAPIGQDLAGFEVAGSDRKFHPATGRVKGKTVTVTCAEVKEPVAVRYCMHNWSVGTLFNCCGMPAGPFRTDDWKL